MMLRTRVPLFVSLLVALGVASNAAGQASSSDASNIPRRHVFRPAGTVGCGDLQGLERLFVSARSFERKRRELSVVPRQNDIRVETGLVHGHRQ